ncbi:MAG: hypothetical protein LBR23_08600 [Spirochaetaceae bacterium]|jgi:hypothetical protein|nr:hypothetical protein [Spirochaetaceae bacterium]
MNERAQHHPPGSNLVVLAVLAVVSLAGRGFAQAPDAVKQFITGSLADKTRIIRNINPAGESSDRVRQLPKIAINFVLTYREDLGDSPGLDELFLAAVEKLDTGDPAADVALLVYLLSTVDSPAAEGAVTAKLYTFAQTRAGAARYAVPALNTFLKDNAPGTGPRKEAVLTAIKALTLCGDSSSFPVLLSYALQSPDTDAGIAARQALLSITDGFETNASRAISELPMPEKLFVFRIIQENSKISPNFKAKCAEIALSQAISIVKASNGAVPPAVIALQDEALIAIVAHDWTPSSALVLSLFPIARNEYETGALSEAQFIAVIKANAALGISGAGRVLSRYLADLNSITGRAALGTAEPETVSAAVVLALINTLGDLGDKTAFDDLLYVTYLNNYGNEIIRSARAALEKLKLQ